MTEPEMVKELEDISALFVQTAEAAESSDGRIVLKNVTPSTIYFSDRPQRSVGHLKTSEFVGFWDQGDDSFSVDPPNAVLAFIGEGDAVPEEVVMEISDPNLGDSELSYAVKVLDGKLPENAGACSLFIDPFGRPLSPISAAGMHRRTRRRTRRRRL